MKNNAVETLVGAFVLFIAAFFFYYAYENSGSKKNDGVSYHATFDRVDGLVKGSDVRMSGVKIGTIETLTIDPQTYLAKVTFELDKTILLPKDSSAEIVSDGLLGGKYLALVPGGDPENMPAGATIEHTQSSVNLESLIGQLIFSNKSKDKTGSDSSDKTDLQAK